MSSTFEFPWRLGQTLGQEPRSCEIFRSKTTTPHFFVAGQSGSGKSSLLYDVICQAMDRGDGVTVIDPGGDLVENIAARQARKFIDTGDSRILQNTHWLEPGNYGVLFGFDPFQFDPAREIHPEMRENALRCWLHTRVHEMGELVQMTQGQMDFEGNARLQRNLTNVLTACGHEVGQKGNHLGYSAALILVDPDRKGHDEIFDAIAPLLDRDMLGDFVRIRAYKRIEDRIREVESLINRHRATLCPQAKAIFAPGRKSLPIRKIIREGGCMLWNLRPTHYFPPNAKAMFGRLAIHSINTTMMTVPREQRRPHMLVIDECSEFNNESLEWALGATRKSGESIWMCSQDLSSLKRERSGLDMVPKTLSQCNIITFQQQLPDDVEMFVRVMRLPELNLKPLIHEVERHGGYDWLKINEISRSFNESSNWTKTETNQESKVVTDSEAHQSSIANSTGSAETRQHSEGGVQTRSRRDQILNEPAVVAKAKSATDVRGHSDTTNLTQSQANSAAHAVALGNVRGESDGVGGSQGRAINIAEKLMPLARIIREQQPTGKTEEDIQAQLMKFAIDFITLGKRQAMLKISGPEKAVKFETNFVELAFRSPLALVKAVEWFKGELYAHHDYYFTADFSPAEEDRQIQDFIRRAKDKPVTEDNVPAIETNSPDDETEVDSGAFNE